VLAAVQAVRASCSILKVAATEVRCDALSSIVQCVHDVNLSIAFPLSLLYFRADNNF
jgi:hypothetical protein